MLINLFFFFFNDTATTEIYTLSLHDALPILTVESSVADSGAVGIRFRFLRRRTEPGDRKHQQQSAARPGQPADPHQSDPGDRARWRAVGRVEHRGSARGGRGTRSRSGRGCPARAAPGREDQDRKSTRLNSSHLVISYAVFCLKKKNLATKVALAHRRILDRSMVAFFTGTQCYIVYMSDCRGAGDRVRRHPFGK